MSNSRQLPLCTHQANNGFNLLTVKSDKFMCKSARTGLLMFSTPECIKGNEIKIINIFLVLERVLFLRYLLKKTQIFCFFSPYRGVENLFKLALMSVHQGEKRHLTSFCLFFKVCNQVDGGFLCSALLTSVLRSALRKVLILEMSR